MGIICIKQLLTYKYWYSNSSKSSRLQQKDIQHAEVWLRKDEESFTVSNLFPGVKFSIQDFISMDFKFLGSTDINIPLKICHKQLKKWTDWSFIFTYYIWIPNDNILVVVLGTSDSNNQIIMFRRSLQDRSTDLDRKTALPISPFTNSSHKAIATWYWQHYSQCQQG